MYLWNPDKAHASGPCVLRPIAPECPDAPAWDQLACGPKSTDWTGVIGPDGKLDHGKCIKETKSCKKADCNDKNVAIDGTAPKRIDELWPQYKLDYTKGHEDTPEEKKMKSRIHTCSWENNFGFPWELGMYWDVKVKGDSEISYCEGGGGDEDFGTIGKIKIPVLNT